MRNASILVVLSFLGLAAARAQNAEPSMSPKHWHQVLSPELREFTPPQAERFVLPNGLVVFMLEDRELPLIDFSMVLRFGEIHEPPGMAGLADATAAVMRSGGSAQYPGDQLDELLENMAATFNLGIGLDSGSASLSVLKEDFDRGLEVFLDVLRQPVFPEEKLELHLAQARTAISKRNDRPGAIATREFRKALYGEKSAYAKVVEYAHVNKIDRTAVQEFHRMFFHPNMFIAGVVGDFDKGQMRAKLEAAFRAWPAKNVKLPDVPRIASSRSKKTFFVERPQLDQTTISLGHVVDLRRDSKDYPAMTLVNHILSGSMSARLFTEVRTRKGLAYSVYGYADIPYNRPGVFACTASTRNEQALDTVEAIRHEIVRLRDGGVTEQELGEARESILSSFVFNFDTSAKILTRQLTYELYGYPMDFAEKLLEAIKRVTVTDVNKAARKYLEPEKYVLLGVGATTGLEPSRSFLTLKDVQLLDVTIPSPPAAEEMVIDGGREKEGQRILAEALEAAGGKREFQAIRSLQATVLLHLKGMQLQASLRSQATDCLRVDVAGPFGPISQIVSKDAAWKATGDNVEELKPREALRNVRMLVRSDLGLMRILASAEEGYNVQALEGTREGERELVGVEIESESLGRVKMWFDARSYLLCRMKYGADAAQKEFEKVFSNHAPFGSLVLARTIVDKDPEGVQQIELQALELNPALDPALFTRPQKASAPWAPGAPGR